MNPDTLQYRVAAVQSATPVQLVCMLYDTLVRDLKRALDAIDSKNIETRAAEVKHALLVLDQLESWLDFNNGGDTAASLSRFYAVARSRIVEGHAKVDPALFQEQIRLFLEVRSAWEQAEATRKASESSAAPKMQSSSSLSCSA
jgi:flagellar secretion chaperone FliS